jgi:hypothetical protein
MALPSSFTINVSTPTTHDVVFQSLLLNGNAAEWVADSPQGDIEGRIRALLGHEVTGKGIVRSRHGIIFPYWNSTKGIYDGFVGYNGVLTRTKTVPVEFSREVLEMQSEMLTNNTRQLLEVVAAGRLG